MYKKAVCHVRAEFPEDNFQGIIRRRRINMCKKNNPTVQDGLVHYSLAYSLSVLYRCPHKLPAHPYLCVW